MKEKEEFKTDLRFIAEYATRLMGSGVHVSRVVRNTKRLGEFLGIVIKMTVLPKTIILTATDKEKELIQSQVVDIPTYPVSFRLNSELSALSWDAYDHRITREELLARYKEIITYSRVRLSIVTLLVGCANASFCGLFGGTLLAMFVVFAATLVGFSLRQYLHRNAINHYVGIVLSAFVASLLASSVQWFGEPSDIALATSVLFLIPGVLLINGVIDVVEGHILIGISRLVQSLLFIISIAVGLSFTLIFVRSELL